MKICFTLDDVIRAKTSQFGKIYKKYKDKDVDLDKLDLSSGDFKEIFGFKTTKEYQEFLYVDYPYEIFAEANTTDKLVDSKFNLWHLNIENDDTLREPVQLMLANAREFNASIGYTCFFLSKLATRIREFYFPTDSTKLWDRADVIVTADKTILESKPEGKISIKINTPYNKECKSDYTYETFINFLEDDKIISVLDEKLNG